MRRMQPQGHAVGRWRIRRERKTDGQRVQQSVSQRGNCYGNTHTVSFWSRFKAELPDGGRFPVWPKPSSKSATTSPSGDILRSVILPQLLRKATSNNVSILSSLARPPQFVVVVTLMNLWACCLVWRYRPGGPAGYA
ncbi:hypothetical protein [Hymenobacter coccineus]|uniref:hypothetical protein n=1 Tax=Hymenobacter coccineus TaxID=1908235 RepID=UPI000F76A301|nr:hypothetical protein [Hymenobacter coccineus]